MNDDHVLSVIQSTGNATINMDLCGTLELWNSFVFFEAFTGMLFLMQAGSQSLEWVYFPEKGMKEFVVRQELMLDF